MKIILLTADYLPNIGGIAAHVHHLSKALAEGGHKVFIIHVQNQREEAGIEKKKLQENLFLYRVNNDESKFRVVRVFNRTRLILKAYDKIIKDHGEVDIIHQHDHRSSNWGMQLLRRKNKWIWTNHSSHFINDVRFFLKRVYFRLLYTGLDGVIGASTKRFKISKDFLGDNVLSKFIPNGVDTNLFKPESSTNVISTFNINVDPEKDFVVLCPSRMVPVKGVLFWAKAVNIILSEKSNADWKFIFLGSKRAFNTNTEYISKIRAILQEPIKQESAILLGNLPMEEMPHINSLADVIVLPSLMDAVSLSALEAMATKKPVVATNVDGLAEVIDDQVSGILVPPSNQRALANAVLKLQDNMELRQNIAEEGWRLIVSKYSWRVIAQETVNFYQEVLQGK